MFPQDEHYIRDHKAQLVREAEQHRMAHTEEPAPLGQRLATAVGDLLINTGTHLKARYTEAEEQFSGLYPSQEPLSADY